MRAMMRSEFQLLSCLRSYRRAELSQTEVYKACVGLANSGMEHEEERSLLPVERELLELRRRMFRGSFDSALPVLEKIILENPGSLYQGDALFLRGTMAHRAGDFTEASRFLDQAAEVYSLVGDEYRELRARINAIICLSSTLETYLSGELYAIEQEARRKGLYELVANIQRGRANEFMANGNFMQAVAELEDAIRNYELDGFPDDISLARSMLAICLQILGNSQEALGVLSRITIRDGKVESYLAVFDDLSNGRIPRLTASHPLSDTPWNAFDVKRSSVPGKILQILLRGPASRDRIIAEVWGGQATDASYTNRLYTAVSSLKRSGKAKILFDGENYSLLP